MCVPAVSFRTDTPFGVCVLQEGQGQGEGSLCRAGGSCLLLPTAGAQAGPALPSPIHAHVPSACAICSCCQGLGGSELSPGCWSSSAPTFPFRLVPFLSIPRRRARGCSGAPRLWCLRAQGGPDPSGLLPPSCPGCWRWFCFPFWPVSLIWPQDPEKGIGHFNVILAYSRNEHLKCSNTAAFDGGIK